MVQHFLSCRRVVHKVLILALTVLIAVPGCEAARKKSKPVVQTWPELLLEGGRKLTFDRTITSQDDTRGKPGFWTKLTNVVLGAPESKLLARPYGIAVDSHNRLIITDPGMGGVHIFDMAQHKYKFLQRPDATKDEMLDPQCVAVDSRDNIYVTDSGAGRIFVFDSNGKYRRAIGSLKGGEGYFKRPTGIAIDPETQHIFVTDTLRNRVFELDPNGQVLRSIGQRGTEPGSFNFPTEIKIAHGMIIVVDAMNFRIEVFDRSVEFKRVIGGAESITQFFRPKGIGIDSEGHIYVVDGQSGVVQVYDLEGNLLYYFGNGSGFGEFQLPAGLFIDRSDRVYVVDSYNHRVQVFQYHGLKNQGEGRN